MSNDPVQMLANMILHLNAADIRRLRELLEAEEGTAGVGAAIPPNLPLKEGGAEAPFEDWAADYFETME